METIWINEVEVSATVDRIEENLFRVAFRVTGKNDLHLLSQLLNQSPLHIRVPSLNQDTNIRVTCHRSSYTDSLNDRTPVDFTLDYKTITAETVAADDWNIFIGTAFVAQQNWAKLRALVELLEERGIFAPGEFDARANHVYERDMDEMSKFLSEGPGNTGND